MQSQRLDRLVDRHQRGRTGGVERHRRTAEVVGVGHPVGDDGVRGPGDRVRRGGRGVGGQEHLVVRGGRADEHPDLGALEPVGGQVRVLQRLPGQLQCQTLLRVDHLGLARTHAEELGVEVAHLGVPQPSRPVRHLGEHLLHVGVTGPFGPAGGRARPGGVGTGGQQAPHVLRAGRPTREPHRQAHHRDVELHPGTALAEGVHVGGPGIASGTVDDVLGERGDGGVLVGDGGVQRSTQQVLQIGGEGHRIARGQPVLLQGAVVGDRGGRQSGGSADPLT